MGHEHEAGGGTDEEVLEQRQAVEVEVVGRLVEGEEVEARQQDGGQVHPGALAARQALGRLVGVIGTEADSVQDRSHGRVEIGDTEARPRLERGGVPVVGPGITARQGPHGGVQLALGHLGAGSPADDVGDGLARLDAQLLGEVADPGVAGHPGDRPRLGFELAHQQAQQGRLPDAVGTGHPDPVAGRDGEGDVGEHDLGAVGEGQVAGDDLRGQAGLLAGEGRARTIAQNIAGDRTDVAVRRRVQFRSLGGTQARPVSFSRRGGGYCSSATPSSRARETARMPRLRLKAASNQARPPMTQETESPPKRAPVDCE